MDGVVVGYDRTPVVGDSCGGPVLAADHVEQPGFLVISDHQAASSVGVAELAQQRRRDLDAFTRRFGSGRDNPPEHECDAAIGEVGTVFP